jgi:periplasmic copper chaperone A
MNRPVHRRDMLGTTLALGFLGLAPSARACEYVGQTLRVYHPWSRGTAADADFAVLCMTLDEVRQTDRLIGVETPVAERAEMGGPDAGAPVDLLLPAGGSTVLTEQGAHIRLRGLNLQLQVGRSYPLALQFERGGRLEATLNIDFPGFRFR